MKKNFLIIIVILAILVAILAVWWFFFKEKSKNIPSTSDKKGTLTVQWDVSGQSKYPFSYTVLSTYNLKQNPLMTYDEETGVFEDIFQIQNFNPQLLKADIKTITGKTDSASLAGTEFAKSLSEQIKGDELIINPEYGNLKTTSDEPDFCEPILKDWENKIVLPASAWNKMENFSKEYNFDLTGYPCKPFNLKIKVDLQF